MDKTQHHVPLGRSVPGPLLRLKDVLKLYPVSKSTLWKGVAEGRYPKPCKLSPRTTAWLQSDIEALIAQVAGQENENG